MMYDRRTIDKDLIALDGGLFAGMPRKTVPLESFHLDGRAETSWPEAAVAASDVPPPMSMATSVRPPPRRPWNKSGLAVGAAAMSVSCLALAGAMLRSDDPPPRASNAAPPVAMAIAAVGAPIQRAPAAPPPIEISSVVEEVGPSSAIPLASPLPAPQGPTSLASAGAAQPAPAATLRMADIPRLPATAGTPISRPAVAVAIAGAGRRASRCMSSEASRSTRVSVTFAPSGRVTTATVNGGPFAGTREGSCLATMLRSATVPPFDGEPVTVNTTVHLR